MAPQSFAVYTKQMKDESGPHWRIEHNALFCEDFEAGKPFPQPDHFEVVDKRLVPFLYEAITTLGSPPGSQWILNVMGQASATGTTDKNLHLSKERAYYLGEYAVAEFEEMWKKYPGGEIPKITPAYHIVGDKLSRKAPTASSSEERQAAFRSVVFFFNAAGPHDTVSGGVIRTVTGMSMKPHQSTFDEVLKTLKSIWEPQSAFFKIVKETLKEMKADGLETLLGAKAKEVLDEASKLSNHPGVFIAKHMISVAIPRNVTYAYQMQDTFGARSMPMIYRFDGVEHSDNIGLLELVSWWAKLDACLKIPKMMVEIPKTWSEMFKLKEDLQKFLVHVCASLAGNRGAILMARLLENYEYFGEGGLIATSDWANFAYDRAMPTKSVHAVAGPAQRFKAGGLWIARETLNFAGRVWDNPANWNATAEIGGVFNPLANSIGQFAKAHGVMTLYGNAPVLDAD